MDEQVKIVEDNLNNRSRKMLNFKTPNEEFFHLTGISLGYSLRC